VWLCRSELLRHFHALKFVSSADSSLLQREFEALCKFREARDRLSCEAILPVEHVNRREDGIFYIMPLADGCGAADPVDPAWRPLSLALKVHRQRGEVAWFSSEEIRGMLAPILQALHQLSEAELVHRDVKPDNILFCKGRSCLGDISLLREDGERITRRGTDGYAAPSWYVESGGHPDMYGAAVTLYVLLTGNSPDKMGRSAFRWPPQGAASLSEEEKGVWKSLHRVIARATSDQVGERFAGFLQFERALRGSLGEQATGSGVAVSPAVPDPVREELQLLQAELEATRGELLKLRGEFDAFIASTLTALDGGVCRAVAVGPDEDLEAVADQFVAGLREFPGRLRLEDRRLLLQRARASVRSIGKLYGREVCARVEQVRKALEKLIQNQGAFHAEKLGTLLEQALALSRSVDWSAVAGWWPFSIVGAVAPVGRGDEAPKNASELLPLRKIIEAAQRFLSEGSFFPGDGEILRNHAKGESGQSACASPQKQLKMDEKDYALEFNETSFWQKITAVARTTGRELAEKILLLYFALMDKDTPLWAKTVLLGALGYFICPIDAIPDMIPVGGYTDDAGAIAAALGAVAVHIKDEHKEQARVKAAEWFS
jgi:uncharacterized membrane protein YkvA (DUF1232 family)